MRCPAPLLLGFMVLVACSHVRTAAPRTVKMNASLTGSCRERGDALLSGVTVVITDWVGRQLTAVTDAQGRFAFPALPAGGYIVRLELAGYVPATSVITLVAGEALNLCQTIHRAIGNFEVASKAPPLDPQNLWKVATLVLRDPGGYRIPTARDPWTIPIEESAVTVEGCHH